MIEIALQAAVAEQFIDNVHAPDEHFGAGAGINLRAPRLLLGRADG